MPIVIPEEFMEKYPNSMETIIEAIAQCSTNDNLAQVISELTGRNLDDVKSDLELGEGPLLNVTNIDDISLTTIGKYSFGEPDDGIQINERYLREFEEDPNKYEELFELLIVCTVIHEFTHYNEWMANEESMEMIINYLISNGGDPEFNSERMGISIFGGVVGFSEDGKTVIIHKR